MQAKINWFGLAGGVATLVVIIVSLFIPWWQLTVGEDLAKASISPFNTNFDLLGTTFTVPLIWALNMVSILSLAASGIVMLVYSVIPTKSYSKHLLGFAYKKPLFSLLFFVIALFALTLLVQAMFSFNIPLMGSKTTTLPTALTHDITISVLLSAEFQWSFWLATVPAGLCIAARIYHKRITTPTTTAPPTVATT